MVDFAMNDLRQFGYQSNLPQNGREITIDPPSIYGQSVTNSIFGLNYMQTPLPVPMNKDHYGLTFFTRPQLNMQRANLKNVREMSEFLTTYELTLERVVRCTLDPRLQFYENTRDAFGDNMGVECRLVDAMNPFIPLLTNHLVSMTGFQDKLAPIFRSQEGQYREVQSMVDGSSRFYGAYNISATFRNSRGDPITKLFDAWVDYSTFVFEGRLTPYLDMMLGGLIDYNTRIYRITLDPSKRFITGIAATGASFPMGVPKGQQYDYNIEKPYNDANNQMTIQFESNGCIWDDPILIWSFNKVVGAFNPSMRTASTRAASMVMVPQELAAFFNCRAYPRIDPATRRMEWWVTKEYYTAMEREATRTIEYMMDVTTGAQRQGLIEDLSRQQGGLLTT